MPFQRLLVRLMPLKHFSTPLESSWSDLLLKHFGPILNTQTDRETDRQTNTHIEYSMHICILSIMCMYYMLNYIKYYIY